MEGFYFYGSGAMLGFSRQGAILDTRVEMLEAEITFLLESEGGRRPLPEGVSRTWRYRPHLVLDDANPHKPISEGHRPAETRCGVVFIDGPNHIEFGKPQIFKMALPFWNPSEYSGIVAEATFTLREGLHIVGHGSIKRRWSEPLAN